MDNSYSDVKSRLDEIVDQVSGDDVSLDDALALFEEAVNLGLYACDMVEVDVDEEDAQADAADSSQVDSPEADAADSSQVDSSEAESSESIEA